MRFWLRVLFTFVCVSSGIAAFAKAYAAQTYFNGEVAKVSDGDTIHFTDYAAKYKKPNLKVRMINIDAPEAHLPTKQGMVGQGKWGEMSTSYLHHLAPVGAEGRLVSSGFDKYHRVLGTLVYKSQNINLEMVRGGWAIPYIICEGDKCDESYFDREHIEEYLVACHEARAAQRGIFNPKHRLKEMPYEFRLRMQDRDPDKYVGDYRTRKLYRPDHMKKVDLCDRIFFLKKKDATRAGFRPSN